MMTRRLKRCARAIAFAGLVAGNSSTDPVAGQVESLANPREIFSAYLGTGDQVQIFNGTGRLVTISIADALQRNWVNSTFGSAQSRVFVLPTTGAIVRIAMARKAADGAEGGGSTNGVKILKYRVDPGARYQIVTTATGELALMVHVTKDTATPATEVP